MSPPPLHAQSSTPNRSLSQPANLPPAHVEEDFALGCECANPALQIETWRTEAAAQPLQKFN